MVHVDKIKGKNTGAIKTPNPSSVSRISGTPNTDKLPKPKTEIRDTDSKNIVDLRESTHSFRQRPGKMELPKTGSVGPTNPGPDKLPKTKYADAARRRLDKSAASSTKALRMKSFKG